MVELFVKEKALSVTQAPRRCRVSEYDRISRLPSTLLCRILSFLSTRESVRTSILSNRWRTLWEWVPGFDMDISDFHDRNVRFPDLYAFLRFVSKFLYSRKVYCKKFRLHCCNELFVGNDPSAFTHWAYYIVKQKIDDLELSSGPLMAKMPQTLYMSPVLARLRLDFVALETPEIVSLPCLKILYLRRVLFANDLALEMLISGCPVLEDLTIFRYLGDDVRVVRVLSQTLKRFDLEVEPSWPGDYISSEVWIDAPKLQYLRLRDPYSDTFALKGLDPTASVDIDVTFNVNHERIPDGPRPNDVLKRTIIRDFFMEVSGVKHMKISAETLEVVYHYLKSDPVFQFNNLSSLHIIFSESTFEILANLLESSLNLKSLVLEWCYLREMDDAIRLSSVPRRCLPFLEHVEIKMPITKVMKVRSLVKYFLENSKALKKLTISSADPAKAHDEISVLTELLTLRRCSSDCQVAVVCVVLEDTRLSLNSV